MPLDGTTTTPLSDTIAMIRAYHRERRFAMTQQGRLDRSLESLIRSTRTDWDPNAPEDVRKAANTLTKKIIAEARADAKHEDHGLVRDTDNGRAAFDRLRKERETAMTKLAVQLPAYEWVKTVPGFGALGLATVVGETGDLSNYPTHKHLWSRCGHAPYGNPERDDKPLAGSTWKRGTVWAGRSLSNEEWVAKPFNAKRYSLFQQIGVSLMKKQLIGKAKTASGETEPNGYYGQIYCERRAFTAKHRDWTPIHSLRDAERIAVKALLHDLWSAWRGDDVEANKQNCRW